MTTIRFGEVVVPLYIKGTEFKIRPLEPPGIYIPKILWNDMLKETDEFRKDGKIRAYRLITKRRHKGGKPPGSFGRPYTVIRAEEIELEFNPDDESNYRYVGQKEAGAYKTRESGERYSGAIEIREELSYTPFDAYRMARELIDFIIFINSAKEHRVYWVDHYWRKHYETTIELNP